MKNWLIKNRAKIITAALVAAVLTGAFFWGGNNPRSNPVNAAAAAQTEVSPSTADTSAVAGSPAAENPEITAENPETTAETYALPDTASSAETNTASSPTVSAETEQAQGRPTEGVNSGEEDNSGPESVVIDPETGKDQYMTDPVSDGKPQPVEPQDATVTAAQLTCTLSVRCDTILSNMDMLDQEKHELVPEDGVIFSAADVTFYEGESVANVLGREMKKAGIQLELENTPVYNSAYIEGLNNLYEFDVGELSGWMYIVNGWFPNYGCSRYQLKDGDVVECVYTCDLGKDVGGSNFVGS